MFYLFLTKKPIVFVWLILIYVLMALIQAGLAAFIRPINIYLFTGGLILCIPFLFIFYRVFRYFCMGYFTIFNKNKFNLLGISLEKFKKHFILSIVIYFIIILLNAFVFFVLHTSVYFFITICLCTLIYEKIFLYVTRWTLVYELAERGVHLSKHGLHTTINEARLLFLSTFSHQIRSL